MPAFIRRSKELDEAIIKMRNEGKIWPVISHELRLSTAVLRDMVNRLNLSDADEVSLQAKNRPPLHAGHPETWGVISNDPFPYCVPHANF